MSHKTLKVPCRQCKQITNHQVLQEQNQDEFDEEAEGIEVLTGNKKYQIIQCLGCEDISFRIQHSSVHFFDMETGTDRTLVELYPEWELGYHTPLLFRAVPDSLEKLYQQTVRAFNMKMDVLCAGGLRALIEGLCSEEGVTEGPVMKKDHDGCPFTKPDGSTETVQSKSLEGKIEGLADKGILTKAHARALHEHRFMGNEALHELRSIPREELKLALDIVEQTFNTVYELPYIQYVLERKRKRRSESKT